MDPKPFLFDVMNKSIETEPRFGKILIFHYIFSDSLQLLPSNANKFPFLQSFYNLQYSSRLCPSLFSFAFWKNPDTLCGNRMRHLRNLGVNNVFTRRQVQILS